MRHIMLGIVILLLAGCADVPGIPLPENGTLAGPCAPDFLRAYWHI